MLPTIYRIPTSLILLAGGLLACFAGYRLFRFVLGLYGFILGALFASSLVSPASHASMLIAAFVGGVVGAVVLTLGYFAGVALVGGGLGVLVAHAFWAQLGWGGPRALLLLAFAIGGGVAAMIFQRYVLIAGTALGGAWTALAGGLALLGSGGRHAADATNVWIVYPFDSASAHPLIVVAWLVLAGLGVIVQLRSAGSRRA